jgi:hypothetical protein
LNEAEVAGLMLVALRRLPSIHAIFYFRPPRTSMTGLIEAEGCSSHGMVD